MKIVICGSIAFIEEMVAVKKQLENLGHEVEMPPLEIEDESGEKIPVLTYWKMRKATATTTGWIWDAKEKAIRLHFGKIKNGDAILVLNHEKNGVPNYIGANTLMEMGLAMHERKPIFLWNPIPEIPYCKEEIIGMKPTVINGDLTKITPR